MKVSTLQRLALYLFFFSINFEVWDPFGISFSISKMTGLIYLLVLIPDLKYFLKSGYIKRFVTPLWTFFIFLTLMNIVNINAESTTFFNSSIFQNIILFILLINHERKEPGILEKGMFSFAIGSICLAILYKLGIGISYSGMRVTIFEDNQNNVGIRMAISLITLIWVIVKNNFNLGRWRYLLLLSFPIMLLLMADTGSRVSFISFTLMFATGLMLFKARHSGSKIIILIFGIALGYLFWAYYISTSEVLIERLLKTEESGNLAGREDIWQLLRPLILNHPFFGSGETGYAQYVISIFGEVKSPHNVILEVLCYTGLLGLFFYLLFCFRVFRIALKRYKLDGSLIQLLLLIPFVGLMLSGQLLTVKIGWIIMAFGASGILYQKALYNKKVLKYSEKVLRD